MLDQQNKIRIRILLSGLQCWIVHVSMLYVLPQQKILKDCLIDNFVNVFTLFCLFFRIFEKPVLVLEVSKL